MWEITKVSIEHSQKLREIADNILAPIYGNQDKAFGEWHTGAGNKHAFVALNENGQVAGLLSMKLSPEKPYLKISTLLVLEIYKGSGCASEMLEYSVEYARKHGYKSILVTVSETKQESIDFFMKKGFIVIRSEKDKYTVGITEHIMIKELE